MSGEISIGKDPLQPNLEGDRRCQHLQRAGSCILIRSGRRQGGEHRNPPIPSSRKGGRRRFQGCIHYCCEGRLSILIACLIIVRLTFYVIATASWKLVMMSDMENGRTHIFHHHKDSWNEVMRYKYEHVFDIALPSRNRRTNRPR